MAASKKGSVDVVKALLDRGADVHAKTVDGRTALEFAVGWGRGDRSKYLPGKETDGSAKTEERRTTLREFLRDILDRVVTAWVEHKHGRKKNEGSEQDYNAVVKLLKAHGATE